MNAIFRSLWQFSMTFAASAILMLLTLYVPALIIFPYKLSIKLAIFFVEPDVIFLISTNL